jgi:hypothetical protein
MKAYHCYKQLKEPHAWYEIELLVQLLSIWHWKRIGGKSQSMGIYTEAKHLKTLEKYSIEKEYDFIDYSELDKLPAEIDTKRFWAIAKIQCQLTIPDKEYCIIDTDAFFREMPDLHNKAAFTAMHNEHHLTDKGRNVYPDMNLIFPAEVQRKLKSLDYIMPVNTSFLHGKDKHLLSTWIDDALKTAIWQSKRKEVYGEMMSIEQRLLPMLAESEGKSYSTLVENIYLPGHENEGFGKEWHPHPSVSGNLMEIGKIFFHLWGFKSVLDRDDTRASIMRALNSDITTYFPERKELIKEKFPTLKEYIF